MKEDLEEVEIELLLEGIYRFHGADFRGYARSSLRRRVLRFMSAEGLSSISAVQERLLHDPQAMDAFTRQLSISVTSMFRDPSFFAALRERVFPRLATYPFFRIWHAGCATGEEVFALAILLREAGLSERALVYATDMNDDVLAQAKRGIFPLSRMQEYTQNYLKAGGARAFSEYYTANYDGAIFDASLIQNVVFAQHNLSVDQVFTEVNVVLCRNVLIYFTVELQNRVLRLFEACLSPFGVLGLGRKETLRFSDVADRFKAIDANERLFVKDDSLDQDER